MKARVDGVAFVVNVGLQYSISSTIIMLRCRWSTGLYGWSTGSYGWLIWMEHWLIWMELEHWLMWMEHWLICMERTFKVIVKTSPALPG